MFKLPVMKNTRRKFTARFKAKVAIEAIQEKLTMQQIATKYEVHPNQISQWKRQFLDNAESIFSSVPDTVEKAVIEQEQDKLYKKIGRLQVENDFLKKSLGEA
jgi:transposase-like protein